MIQLGRSGDTARRQAAVTPIVLREYISEALADGDERAAIDTFQALFAYLRSDTHGRRAHRHMSYDPIDILRHFLNDERLDARYRERSLPNMIRQLENQRTFRGRITAIFEN